MSEDMLGGHRCSRAKKEFIPNLLPVIMPEKPVSPRKTHVPRWALGAHGISSQFLWESKGSMNTWEISINLFQQPHPLVSQIQINAPFIQMFSSCLLNPHSVPARVGAQIHYTSALTQSLQAVLQVSDFKNNLFFSASDCTDLAFLLCMF